MDELRSILATHHPRHSEKAQEDVSVKYGNKIAPTSEIPDLFFDQILVNFKLNRMEVMVLMYLYRHVWCRPNLYRKYGISQVLSHTEIGNKLNLSIDEVYQSLRKLESLDFIETIRSGQYFVRKFFTAHFDKEFGFNYEDF